MTQPSSDQSPNLPAPKRCSKCGEDKPLCDFSKDKSRKDGHSGKCKACDSARYKAWREANLERARETNRAWREANPGRVRETSRAWREANPERARETRKARREANPERVRETNRAWREANPERRRELGRAWRKANPEAAKAEKHRRRARKKGAEGSYTAADIQLQYNSQKGKCWHCGKPLNGEYHVDHLIPLARGGTNWPNNLVCACAKCNLSKQDKLPSEWNGKLF